MRLSSPFSNCYSFLFSPSLVPPPTVLFGLIEKKGEREAWLLHLHPLPLIPAVHGGRETGGVTKRSTRQRCCIFSVAFAAFTLFFRFISIVRFRLLSFCCCFSGAIWRFTSSLQYHACGLSIYLPLSDLKRKREKERGRLENRNGRQLLFLLQRGAPPPS